MTRHPATEGNELHPSDVIIPDPSGGDGRLSVRNDLAAEFAGLSISSTEPTDMPNGGVWVNLSADPTGIDRLQTYDESTDAFIPISADRTIVSEEQPEPEIGLLWFEPVEDGANLYASSSNSWEFLQFISAIPDTTTSRTADNDAFAMSNSEGLSISPNSGFGQIAARISSNTSGATRARLYDFDDEDAYVETVDISGLSAGDTFVFNYSFVSGQDYGFELDNAGSQWTYGWFNGSNNADYPITGEDIDIVGRSQNGSQNTTGTYRAINDIGNPDNVLG